jgi:protein-serine/threonine kinase
MPLRKKLCGIDEKKYGKPLIAALGKKADKEQLACKKLLGAGGYGEAFKYEKKQDRVVKVSYTDRVSPTQAAVIIKKQKKIAKIFQSSCEHHNVMCHYDTEHFYDANSRTLTEYLITSYIKGKSMDEYKYSASKFFNVLKQYILAVEYMHDNGVVHYDLKPENVMLDVSGKLFIIDLGLAELVENGKVKLPSGYTPGFQPDNIEDKYEVRGMLPANIAKYYDFYALGRSFFQDGRYEIPLTKSPWSKKNQSKLYRIEDLFRSMNERNYKSVIDEVWNAN